MFATKIAVPSPTYCTIPRTSIETRDMQENTSTQADTNELLAPEKRNENVGLNHKPRH